MQGYCLYTAPRPSSCGFSAYKHRSFHRGGGWCTSMPWGLHKHGEPTHCKRMWEHLPHRGTNRTSKPRIKATECLDKERIKSRSPGKEGEEIPRGVMHRGSQETICRAPLQYQAKRRFVETSYWSKLSPSILPMLLLRMYQGNPSPVYGIKGLPVVLSNRNVHLW